MSKSLGLMPLRVLKPAILVVEQRPLKDHDKKKLMTQKTSTYMQQASAMTGAGSFTSQR
jgi:hypothetical protein